MTVNLFIRLFQRPQCLLPQLISICRWVSAANIETEAHIRNTQNYDLITTIGKEHTDI